MKPCLWHDKIIQSIENKSTATKKQERSGLARLVFVREIFQVQHWAQIYIINFLLVKLAAVAQSRLQWNWFNLVLAEIYASQMKEAFLQCVDVFVPSNFSSMHGNSATAATIQGIN